MNMPKTTDVTLQTLDSFVESVFALLKSMAAEGAVVLALSGDLGAGKTTFTQALGKHLGVSEAITSPTFTIMKGYETTNSVFTYLVHMDAYRIEDEDELRPLRFAEILNTPHTLVVVEWAERIVGALPKGALHLTLSVKDETTRTATLSYL